MAAAAYISISLHSRSLTDLVTTLAAILGRRQPHNVPPLHTAEAVHEVVTEEYSILEFSELRVGDQHAGRLGVSLRGSLLLGGSASSAALPTGDWLTTLTARAHSLQSSRPVSCRWLCLGPPTLLGVHAKSHREVCLVPFVRGLAQLPAVWDSLRVKPRWLGPPLSKRVLFLSPRCCLWLLLQNV